MARLPWGNIPQICMYCGAPGARSIDDRGRRCHDRCLPLEQKRQRRRIEHEVAKMRELFWSIAREEQL